MPDRAPDIEFFKGFPIIKIYTGKEYQGEAEFVSLGVRKARAICDNIDYVRKFVADNEK